MMKIIIVTLFPEVFTYLDASIIRRAREKGIASVEFVNPRDFTFDRHRTVDDTPYGGGSGMVIKPEPIYLALQHIRMNISSRGKTIMTTPQGRTFNQRIASSLSKEECLIFLCGHYEGFDERVHTLADVELSIGDYVLTGGELPVMVIIDSIVRLLPGAIDEESAEFESFNDSLLDHPHYTRPAVFEGMSVPPVLLSGNHEKIRRWRRYQRIKRTRELRPDLFQRAELTAEDYKIIAEFEDTERRSGNCGILM